MTAQDIIKELQDKANKELAAHHSKFFKTGKGEYAEGDLFYGIKVPEVRRIASSHYKELNLADIQKLIQHQYHEVRLAALVILMLKFNKALEEEREKIYNFYISNVNYINNWDLVDLSAKNIVGGFLFEKNIQPIWNMARSKHLWSERIAILATFYFINKNQFTLSLELAEFFLDHKHDLMHKATGWMLREIGKKDIDTLYTFLDKFHKIMPRTMLRYSIEKLSESKRKFYMQK